MIDQIHIRTYEVRRIGLLSTSNNNHMPATCGSSRRHNNGCQLLPCLSIYSTPYPARPSMTGPWRPGAPASLQVVSLRLVGVVAAWLLLGTKYVLSLNIRCLPKGTFSVKKVMMAWPSCLPAFPRRPGPCWLLWWSILPSS